jgi:hypothetical protein
VLPNESRGPEWYSSEALGASLIYVKKEENRGNPIYRADVRQWRSDSAGFLWRLSDQFEQETRLHEEVTAARAVEGLRLAFASQEGERLRLQLREGLNPTYGKVEAETEKAEAGTTRAASPKNCRIQFAAKEENDEPMKRYKKRINESLKGIKAEIIKVKGGGMRYKLVSSEKKKSEQGIDEIIEEEVLGAKKFEKLSDERPISKCYQKVENEL